MMLDRLKDRNIILASQSPRRHYLLKQLGLEFTEASSDFDESIPDNMTPDEIARHLALMKASHFDDLVRDDRNIVITADTLVFIDGKVIGKPEGYPEAKKMLRLLSGKKHQVVTGVVIRSNTKQVVFTAWTDVYFKELSDEEIDYYLEHYKPYDKAGAYGIQEWIGHIGIRRIDGSYFNVMGLPVQRVYEELANF